MWTLFRQLSVLLAVSCLLATALMACSPLESANSVVPTAAREARPAPKPTSPPATLTNAPSSYKFLRQWGCDISSNGRFKFPDGIAVDTDGNVYVGDGGNSRIQKFSSKGILLVKWGSQGEGNGQFSFGNYPGDDVSSPPASIAVDHAGNVHVVDTDNSRVQKFDSEGAFLAKWGSAGHEDEQFFGLGGIAVDIAGNVYLMHAGNSSIQKFNPEGVSIAEWNRENHCACTSSGVRGLAVDASGNVYAAGAADSPSPLRKFNSEGTIVARWGSYGSGDGQFKKPGAIAVDQAGNIYVADTNNHRVQKFSATGEFLAKWGSDVSSDGQFGAYYRSSFGPDWERLRGRYR
jgi:tripartite motif-containing protein 71